MRRRNIPHRKISIHALCEEGDRCPGRALLFLRKISIHALCEEGDAEVAASRSSREDFYPRPLRGGRRSSALCQRYRRPISIHALCEEGDAA